MSFIRPTTSAGAAPGSFFTNFPANETPISEGGKWQVCDASNFTPWGTTTSPPFTSGGVWHANAGSSGNDDSVSFLKPSVGILNNQTITCVVFVGGAFGVAEIEIHLRSSWNSTQIFSIEVDIINSSNTVNLVDWLGDNGTINVFATGTLFSPLADNDVWVASVNSSHLVTVTQNGHTVASGTTSIHTGSCGLGGDVGSGNTNNVGFRSISVVSS